MSTSTNSDVRCCSTPTSVNASGQAQPPGLANSDIWPVVSSFFAKYGLVQQQIDSFNTFIEHDLQQIIDETPPIVLETEPTYQTHQKRYFVKFGTIRFSPPSIVEDNGEERVLFPHEARLRSLTYTASVFVDVDITNDADATVLRSSKVPLGRIPVVVRSKLCRLWDPLEKKIISDDEIYAVREDPLDQGGYFIVKGSERVIVPQERMANNSVYVYLRLGNKWSYVSEFRSTPTYTPRVIAPLFCGIVEKDGLILLTMPSIRRSVPLCVVFFAMGIESHRDILRLCIPFHGAVADPNYLSLIEPSLEQALGMCNRDRAVQRRCALDHIGRRGAVAGTSRDDRIAFAANVIDNEFLPHIGTGAEHTPQKAAFLGYVVYRLLEARMERRPVNDRDDFSCKRLDLTGTLMAELFRRIFTRLVEMLRRELQRQLDRGNADFNVAALFDSSAITNGFRHALATGNWTTQLSANIGCDGSSGERAGVSQLLDRTTYMSTLSHLRRLNAPIDRDGKVPKSRQLHSSQWGIVCPCETPERDACGLVKGLALMSLVTTGSPPQSVISRMADYGVQTRTWYHDDVERKVFVNGCWVGMHPNGVQLTAILRTARSKGDIDRFASIVHDYTAREITVTTDPGRLVRPLLVVCESRLLLAVEHLHRLSAGDLLWDDLVDMGIVEFVDVDEEMTLMIALEFSDLSTPPDNVEWTHAELHPAMILGICATLIPFPHHNQSPRNTYQSAMGKQALGFYATNYNARMDTTAHVLYYPQQPLVMTTPAKIAHMDEFPAGVNAITAIMTYEGYNQEDSKIVNQAAIDRGLLRTTLYRTYFDTAKSTPQKTEFFDHPRRRAEEGTRVFGTRNYGKLDTDGLAEVGVRLSGNDVIFGKLAYSRHGHDRDISQTVRTTENGVVDQVMKTTTDGGETLVKARIRSVRIPEIGDKISSRHGQKGTIGMTYSQENMPFTRDGISPDIIMNPHAIPSRMTIAQLVECQVGKIAAIGNGRALDATAFVEVPRDLKEQMRALGYPPFGAETMYSGATGRMLETKAFIGPTYYQRLKHMVADKLHSRGRGPVTQLTRQPPEGRSHHGGHRFGEMERDCVISHGALGFLLDRMLHNSDEYAVQVCKKCGFICSASLAHTAEFWCGTCQDRNSGLKINIPFALKLLHQEMAAMGVGLRLLV